MKPSPQELDARFAKLPKPVQDAITSAEVEQHLRGLSDEYKLHLDQWEELENQVMLTLLGFQKPEDLQKNIRGSIAVSDEIARALAINITNKVFVPIRTELESILSASHAASLVMPATPPAEPPGATALREMLSKNYVGGGASHERKVVEGDPYREQLA